MASTPRHMRRVPLIRPGRYADGEMLHELQYLQCKLILKPDRFTSRGSFFEFAHIVKKVAKQCHVGFDAKGFADARPRLREVVFLDTPDRRLYAHAFILRRRVAYEDGFPIGEPEIVFKFRHADLQKAAEVDVRPRIAGPYKLKFKAEALALKDSAGSLRMLYSHNVQFPLSSVHEGNRTSMATLVRVLPALRKLKRSNGERVELVNQAIVEEVLQDVAMLDFGKGIQARANVSLWRTRGEHLPLVGEFAFQVRFRSRAALHDRMKARAEQFFVSLQHAAKDWLLLGATKTRVVYQLQGDGPQAYE